MGEDATGIPTINKKQLMSLILLEQHGECRHDNISAVDGQKKKNTITMQADIGCFLFTSNRIKILCL